MGPHRQYLWIRFGHADEVGPGDDGRRRHPPRPAVLKSRYIFWIFKILLKLGFGPDFFLVVEAKILMGFRFGYSDWPD
jgi:hypothetical protein